MKQGKSRFKVQTDKIESCLKQSLSHTDPALWLFEHDLRTPMFMLEGLSKLYANLHNEKLFDKLNDRYKAVEDALGGVDYYAAFQKEFAANDRIPAAVKNYLSTKTLENLSRLNGILVEENWLDGKRLIKIEKKLEDADWLGEKEETEAIKGFYLKQIKKIKEFTAETTFVFDNVEDDVHELRRKIRWLSIYPQALQGAIKLQATEPVAAHLKKYITEAIVTMPYNKLPVSGTQTKFLLLEQNYFFALSWMIAELGKIKDSGLRIHILQEAFMAAENMDEEEAMQKVYTILGNNYPRIETLLHDAGVIARQYFTEQNLDHLIVGVNPE